MGPTVEVSCRGPNEGSQAIHCLEPGQNTIRPVGTV